MDTLLNSEAKGRIKSTSCPACKFKDVPVLTVDLGFAEVFRLLSLMNHSI